MGLRFKSHAMRMLRSALLVLLVLGLPGSGQARTETFRWLDPNPAPSPVVNFRAHLGPDSGNYTDFVDLGVPTPDPVSGVYTASTVVPDNAVLFVALTTLAIDDLESDFSNEQVRLGAPESTIDAPAGPITITAGQSVFFEGSGTDPDYQRGRITSFIISPPGSPVSSGRKSFSRSSFPRCAS